VGGRVGQQGGGRLLHRGSFIAAEAGVSTRTIYNHFESKQQTDFPEHFAMVRRILPEAPHFPPAVLEAWQDAGPRRIEREVARRVEQLAERGLLRVEDPAQAAVHLIALTVLPITTRARYGEPPSPRARRPGSSPPASAPSCTATPSIYDRARRRSIQAQQSRVHL
jgi:AcrR family transcriptional regulator